MQIAIISDTHIPSRASSLPPWVRERVASADHTIHAGDFDSVRTYEDIELLSGGHLTAVRGNVDRLDLPETTTVQLGGVRFVVTHGTGGLNGYRDRIVETIRDTDPDAVGVCGHTHEYMDEYARGVRLLNPGSATGAEPAEAETMMIAAVESGELTVTRHDEP